MFGAIAPSYDLLNHLLSLNVDKYWRWRTTQLVPPAGSGPILDVFTRIGQAISQSKDNAYRYLPASVVDFPDGEALAERLRQHGLHDVRWQPLTFGIATLYVGTK